MNYELHPLCTLFPRMDGREFDALVADIKANGLREPIVLHDGTILDGGNRYRACLAAGVEPEFAAYGGPNIVSFVLSANLHRRHLTPGQQAAIVASAQDWAKAQPRGGDRRSDQSATLHFDRVEDRAAVSGASVRTQKMADKVAREAPGLAAQVAHGETTLPKAHAQVTGRAREPRPDPGPPPRDEMQDAISALIADNDRLKAENDTLRRAADPKAIAKIEELKGYIRTVESQRDDYMRQNAELKREVKRLHRKLGIHA